MSPHLRPLTFTEQEAHVDYATFTVKTGQRAIRAWDRARELQESEHQSGQKLSPWKGFAYLGWASSHITVGRRLDSVIIRLSGSVAHTFWRSFHAMSDNCSRLDLALTARVEPVDERIAHRSLREFEGWRKDHDRRIKRRLIDGGPDGSTFELGSRSSDQYGRIYDKHAEQPAAFPPGTWRYEYEAKGDFAQAFAVRLYDAKDHSSEAGDLAADFFRDRGITVPLAKGRERARYRPTRETVTAEARLMYLERSIKPMVRELTLEVGQQAVMESLGFYEYAEYEQAPLMSLEREAVANGNG